MSISAESGLGMKSTAPASSARSVVSAPSRVSALTMMIGGPRRATIARAASSPPIPGISTSIVTTSGRRRSTIAMPSSPDAAVPTTRISGSFSSIFWIARRMNAESSVTTTVIGRRSRRHRA